jgi:hypothetical protein
VVDFPDSPPPHEIPAEEKRVAAPLDTQPRALAASALTKPPSRKVKADKGEAKEKARRGRRGGKKKRKAKRSKP